MSKKPLLLGLIMGLMAMAFVALPAMASAAPSLTGPAGSLVKVGTTITATSTNVKTEFPAFGKTITCEKAVFHGNVTENAGTRVTVAMDGETDIETGCKLGSEAWSVKPTLTSISLISSSKTMTFDFTTSTGISESSTSNVTCNSANPSSSVHIEGPFTGTIPGTFKADFTASGQSGAVLFDC